MSGLLIPIYRLPNERSTQVGKVKVVKDRKQRYYIDGGVVTVTLAGEFATLERADGRAYYVRVADLEKVPGPR